MIGRATAIWLALMLVAISNGLLREAVFVPQWGVATAHIISTLLLSVLIVAVGWFTIAWIAPPSAAAALQAGAWWLVLTLAFEFGFGRWRGKSWAELLADYDLTSGRIWVLVLVVTWLTPWLAGRWRGMWATGS